VNEGTGDTFEVGIGGHYSYSSTNNPAKFVSLNSDLTYKLRLKVLEGRFDPEPQDIPMLKAFKKTRQSPKAFLKRWNG